MTTPTYATRIDPATVVLTRDHGRFYEGLILSPGLSAKVTPEHIADRGFAASLWEIVMTLPEALVEHHETIRRTVH